MQRLLCLSVALLWLNTSSLLCQTLVFDQVEEPPRTVEASSDFLDPFQAIHTSLPLNAPTPQVNDILWQKRVWREIDTREKLNAAFNTPNQSLWECIQKGLATENFSGYDKIENAFTPLSTETIHERLVYTDSITVRDPVTGQYEIKVVTNEIDPAKILRWRLEEVWYFDSRHSRLEARIIAIAPLLDQYDESGQNFKYTRPLFWLDFQSIRPWLAENAIFNNNNDHKQISWDDLFMMRRFSSYITQESDIHGRRLQDYLSGVDLLGKSTQIKESIHNREMDAWSY